MCNFKSIGAFCAVTIAVAIQTVRADTIPQLFDARAETQAALKEYDDALGERNQHPDVARARFRSAARRLQNVIDSGIENGRLEYNLGNALLQSGDVGHAIVHYRRAERLAPRDSLLNDNLTTARSRCLTQIKSSDRLGLLRSLVFWHYDSSVNERIKIGLAAYAAGFVLIAIRAIRASRGISISGGIALAIACVMGVSIGAATWSDRNHPDGVITSMDVAVRRGPGVNDERLFQQPLQPGVEFTTLERRREWWKIELPDGNGGWIQALTAELIPTPRRDQSNNT
ncbi:MAG: hypothetical protein HY287_05155 [Planctomycetes bacterium]|nr:hypothetical protein [Planctomycetota bacterium]MBI3833701.1 hypothetical protein [Planctomycetota bacterium]